MQNVEHKLQIIWRDVLQSEINGSLFTWLNHCDLYWIHSLRGKIRNEVQHTQAFFGQAGSRKPKTSSVANRYLSLLHYVLRISVCSQEYGYFMDHVTLLPHKMIPMSATNSSQRCYQTIKNIAAKSKIFTDKKSDRCSRNEH